MSSSFLSLPYKRYKTVLPENAHEGHVYPERNTAREISPVKTFCIVTLAFKHLILSENRNSAVTICFHRERFFCMLTVNRLSFGGNGYNPFHKETVPQRYKRVNRVGIFDVDVS